MNKEGSFVPIFIVMVITLVVAFLWNKLELIKTSAHLALDPSAGALLNWNLTWGMLILIVIIALITTLIQKYATDQKTLKEMKGEQKKLQAEMKEFRDNPEKFMELQKKQLEFFMPMMKLGMRSIVYTGVPFILLFRWFGDYFAMHADFRFFGFITWIWFYIIFVIIFSSIFRKWLDVA